MSVSTSFKLVLLGDGRVGKTSLVSRFAENRFSSTEESTVKAQMYKRARMVVDGHAIDVSVWDTAGQERFHALGPLYYRGADGAVLVYDITDADSFVRVKQWVKELKKTIGDDICLVLCGNKCDLERDKAVQQSDAERLAARYRAVHFYTSAKNDINVQDAFQDVIQRAVRRRFAGDGDVNDLFGAAPRASAHDADVLYGAPASDSGPSPSGGPKRRRKLRVGGDAFDESATGDATGAANEDPELAAALGKARAADAAKADSPGATGTGGSASNSHGATPRRAEAIPAEPAHPPAGRGMRVVLRPEDEGRGGAGGARAPRAPEERKKKKGCC